MGFCKNKLSIMYRQRGYFFVHLTVYAIYIENQNHIIRIMVKGYL